MPSASVRTASALAIRRRQSAAHGIGERLLDHERSRTRAPGSRPRRSPRRAPRPRDDHPREEVGREDRGRHHDHPDVLDRRVGGVDVVDPPERRDAVGVQRVERDRVVPLGGRARLGDAARDLRVLELVGEEPRASRGRGSASRRGTDEQEIRSDRESDGADGSAGRAAVECLHGAQHDHAGRDRSRAGRTGRGHPAAAQARTTASSRSAGACGIVTSTVSGWAAARIRSMSSVPPRTRHAEQPAADAGAGRRRRSRPPARPGVSRSSRSRLRPERPAPTISVRRPSRSRQRRAGAEERALAEPRGADHDHAEQRVEDEDARREVAERRRAPRRSRPRPLPRRRRRATIEAASREPA